MVSAVLSIAPWSVTWIASSHGGIHSTAAELSNPKHASTVVTTCPTLALLTTLSKRRPRLLQIQEDGIHLITLARPLNHFQMEMWDSSRLLAWKRAPTPGIVIVMMSPVAPLAYGWTSKI